MQRFWLICLIWLLLGLVPSSALAEIRPSQVLVLYNADWQEDHPLSEPGQDSREIAAYYVRMRTDPATGEKPHLLGLSCRRMGASLLVKDRLLNADHLEEKSADNSCGVVLEAEGKRPQSACEFSDGRMVEFTLPASPDWQWDTLDVTLVKPPEDEVPVIRRGVNRHPGHVAVQRQGEWNVRFNGHLFLQGSFEARASCTDGEGQRHEWNSQYADAGQAVFSPAGTDGKRDDLNYLECIEEPVKAFLEDPANALPDGTLLKDHILFIVIAYGLPRTVVAPYGIAVGITEQQNNFGRFIDLGQRLQLMYLDLEKLRGTEIQPMRFTSRSGSASTFAFTQYALRTPLSQPFLGPQANPFLHPLVYQKSDPLVRKHLVRPMAFRANTRNRLVDRRLYFSMRLDAPDPVLALELIDRAAYAARHAGPGMGVLPGQVLGQDEQRLGSVQGHAPSRQFWDRGFRHLSFQPSGSKRLELFRLAPDAGFFNTEYAYLPGGIAVEVESHQGWNRPQSRFMELFQRGVTFTAAAARVYQGAPHIHNRSFWDDAILYPFLLQGRTMGEALLMNQIHLGWITTFVGDPLFRLPENPIDDATPFPDEPGLKIVSVSHPDLGRGLWVMAALGQNPEHLKVAQMALTSHDPSVADAEPFRAVNPRFSARPHVFIPASELQRTIAWRLELMDPFGNRYSGVVELE